MSERYEPSAEFLKAVLSEAVPFVGDAGAHNMKKLIAFTLDDDPSNRDWAALLLSQQDIDTEEVRGALFRQASEDTNSAARAEAVLGLAQRSPDRALPLVKRELASGQVTAPILEAAELIADKSLIADLRGYTSRPETPISTAWLWTRSAPARAPHSASQRAA